ncbi:uncharacterized protein RCO7_11456 [Rhynchosporium graminicola]|uniref:Zn(2)-C6 fungal-type domain-containing protein n=1 Tax=Rhynchosporium graminicola TaxID=2792576 RepID=A0A1E1LN92_9HELO|nr:uncharacterized protein RCO7_11456 [Rhynchosporium commune]
MSLVSNYRAAGRNVTHSRDGCLGCKARRRRCSEERPACTRCLTEGRTCTYLRKLHWEDESAGRGIKHGRRVLPNTGYVDPKPPSGLLECSGWRDPRNCEYFVNTDATDLEAKPFQPLLPIDDQVRRLSLHPQPQYALQMRDLSASDGLLLQYYNSKVCHQLTLVDDISNGFRQVVLPMSELVDSVRDCVLAVGALYLSLDQPKATTEYYAIALKHKQRALNSLRSELSSVDEISTETANLICKGDLRSREPAIVSFVSRFFAIRDVMGRSACGAKPKFRNIEWHDPQEIDKSVGCSYELMNVISNITDLSRQPNISGAEQTFNMAACQLRIEDRLDSLAQNLPLSLDPSSAEAQLLISTSTLVHTAAKIYFYTALHNALPSTHIVSVMVSEQVHLIKEMNLLRSAHLWSLFVTALYAANDEQRIFFLGQFDKLGSASASAASTDAARTIVETVWKRRDLEADVVGSQVVMNDWERIVRPMSEGLSLA